MTTIDQNAYALAQRIRNAGASDLVEIGLTALSGYIEIASAEHDDYYIARYNAVVDEYQQSIAPNTNQSRFAEHSRPARAIDDVSMHSDLVNPESNP